MMCHIPLLESLMPCQMKSKFLVFISAIFRIGMCVVTQAYFKCGESVEYVFHVCERLRLPEEAKYTAVEILHRYLHNLHVSIIVNLFRYWKVLTEIFFGAVSNKIFSYRVF